MSFLQEFMQKIRKKYQYMLLTCNTRIIIIVDHEEIHKAKSSQFLNSCRVTKVFLSIEVHYYVNHDISFLSLCE